MASVSIVSRGSWGARWGRGPTSITPQNGGVCFHYNGGPISRGSHSQCAARVRSIESYHVNGNGWSGIAYNYLICHHGVIFEGRGWGRRSAAQGTNYGNQNYLAIMFLMGGSQDMTKDMRRAGRALVMYLRNRGAGNRVRPHSSFTSTSCPGNDVRSWISSGLPSDGGSINVPGLYEEYNRTAEPGERMLSLYSVGDDVKHVQRWAGVEDDGYYGPLTVSGVKVMQRTAGIEDDGIVGPITWSVVLGKALPEETEDVAPKWPGVYLTQPPVMTHRSCERWQKRMRKRGWRITVDSWYGPKSEGVCRAFQQEKGLGVDGIVGPNTWKASWEEPIT